MIDLGPGIGVNKTQPKFERLWTPAQISTQIWHDAATPSTIILNGNQVSQWNDRSGNGINIAQATDSLQPDYTKNTLNGLPVVTFDMASGEERLGVITSSFSTSDFAFIILAKVTGVENASSSIVSYHDTTTSEFWQIRSFNDPQFDGQYNGVGSGAGGSITYNQTNVTDWAMWGTDAELDVVVSTYFNGVFQASGAFYEAFILTNIEYFLARSAGNDSIDCQIAEAIMFPRSDRVIVEGYLAWKWGRQDLLPIGHTYKTSRPRI